MFPIGWKLPARLAAGDCRLSSLSTGSVLLTGVIADLGVGGTDAGLTPVLRAAEYGVEGVKVVRPPHRWHLTFSLEPAASCDMLPRRLLRFG